ncbi:hypothetical protein NEDG_00247 [Nematocida displodere]|uniref:Transmembrane protein n=1 Tax=Nematocida displodere TaxID=1805483 RepID=A0A177EKY7_9MICR|nr:hypothetical protein NEDG_00247 [Nematocida displodere]
MKTAMKSTRAHGLLEVPESSTIPSYCKSILLEEKKSLVAFAAGLSAQTSSDALQLRMEVLEKVAAVNELSRTFSSLSPGASSACSAKDSEKDVWALKQTILLLTSVLAVLSRYVSTIASPDLGSACKSTASRTEAVKTVQREVMRLTPSARAISQTTDAFPIADAFTSSTIEREKQPSAVFVGAMATMAVGMPVSVLTLVSFFALSHFRSLILQVLDLAWYSKLVYRVFGYSLFLCIDALGVLGVHRMNYQYYRSASFVRYMGLTLCEYAAVAGSVFLVYKLTITSLERYFASRTAVLVCGGMYAFLSLCVVLLRSIASKRVGSSSRPVQLLGRTALWTTLLALVLMVALCVSVAVEVVRVFGFGCEATILPLARNHFIDFMNGQWI